MMQMEATTNMEAMRMNGIVRYAIKDKLYIGNLT
jgi:hypothetical protein